MRPGTIHVVITLKSGFAVGEHFLTRETLEDTLITMIQLIPTHGTTSNASHNLAVAKTFCRLLVCWSLFLDPDMTANRLAGELEL